MINITIAGTIMINIRILIGKINITTVITDMGITKEKRVIITKIQTIGIRVSPTIATQKIENKRVTLE